MKVGPRSIAFIKTAAPTVATILIAWWAHSARMAELALERLKIEKELERRVGQVEEMRSRLYE